MISSIIIFQEALRLIEDIGEVRLETHMLGKEIMGMLKKWLLAEMVII